MERCQLDADRAGLAAHPDPRARADLLRLRGEVREIMDRAEGNDPDLFERAHVLLDEVGRAVNRHYPKECVLAYRDGTHFHECPVRLAHQRVGLSPETWVDQMTCSICGGDPDDCNHIPGRVYDGQPCTIHVEAIMEAVALVGRPRQPVARFTSLGIMTDAELRRRLGPIFRPGIRLRCDVCQTGCPGLMTTFQGTSHG